MSLNVRDLLSATAYDNNGGKLGDVNEVFVDDASGQPTFVDVNHGLFGMGNSLVPLRGHSVDGDSLTLGFAKDRIKNAPDFDSDKPLTPQQQTEIYEHYGISEAADVQGYTGGERPETTETSTADTKAAGAGAAGAGVAGAGAAGAGVAGAGVTGAAATDSGTSDSTTDEERPRPDFSDNVRSDEAATAGNSATETPAASTAAAGAGGVAGTSTADGSASDASTNGANKMR